MRSKSKDRKYTSARERAEKQKDGFTAPYLKLPDGVTLFKPKAGTFLLDILPYTTGEGNPWADEGSLHWERTFYVHRGIGANNDTFLCPRMTAKKRCPVCEHRIHLMKQASGDEEDEKYIKDLSPKQRQLFNLVNRKDPDAKKQLWDHSYHTFGRMLDARLRNADEDDEWEKFFFLEDGLTIKVSFVEKSMGGYTFVDAESIDFKARKEPYDDSVLEEVQCLDDLLVLPDYDELKAALLQTEDEEDEDEEDEKPPSKRVSKSVRSERDEDEPEDEEEEEEDEKPRAGKHKSKPSGDADVEEEDDDEDDEPPKKKTKPKDEDDEDWDEDDEPKKKKSKPVEEDEEEEEDDEEPAPKKKKAKPADEEEEDWEDLDEEEEEEPAPKKKHKK